MDGTRNWELHIAGKPHHTRAAALNQREPDLSCYDNIIVPIYRQAPCGSEHAFFWCHSCKSLSPEPWALHVQRPLHDTTENTPRPTNEQEYMCLACGITISGSTNIPSHVLGQRHLQKLAHAAILQRNKTTSATTPGDQLLAKTLCSLGWTSNAATPSNDHERNTEHETLQGIWADSEP